MAPFGKDAPAHAPGQFPAHRPEGDLDAIPAEVAEAAVRFEFAASADIRRKKLFRRLEAEHAVDAPDGADVPAIVERWRDWGEPRAVAEHDSIHELHPVAPTRGEDLGEIGHGDGARFFGNHMLAG